MLTIPAQISQQMIDHAKDGLPNEACGLFAGQNESGEIARFYPMENAAHSVEIFQFAPLEHIDIETKAEEESLTIIGVMHSHTYTAAYPSPTDVADASNFDPFGTWHHLIVSLQHKEPSIRSYRIKDGQISEEEVKIV